MSLRVASSTVDLTAVKIETDRLLLRPLSHGDTQDIFDNFTADVTRFMMPTAAAAISETEAFITNALDAQRQGREVHCVICKHDDGEFLGICGLHTRDSGSEPELGIWLKVEVHGNRYGYEAIAALVKWASQNLLCERFIYPVDWANRPSRAIAERLGGYIVDEKRVKSSGGRVLDEIVYAIPRSVG